MGTFFQEFNPSVIVPFCLRTPHTKGSPENFKDLACLFYYGMDSSFQRAAVTSAKGMQYGTKKVADRRLVSESIMTSYYNKDTVDINSKDDLALFDDQIKLETKRISYIF